MTVFVIGTITLVSLSRLKALASERASAGGDVFSPLYSNYSEIDGLVYVDRMWDRKCIFGGFRSQDAVKDIRANQSKSDCPWPSRM